MLSLSFNIDYTLLCTWDFLHSYKLQCPRLYLWSCELTDFSCSGHSQCPRHTCFKLSGFLSLAKLSFNPHSSFQFPVWKGFKIYLSDTLSTVYFFFHFDFLISLLSCPNVWSIYFSHVHSFSFAAANSILKNNKILLYLHKFIVIWNAKLIVGSRPFYQRQLRFSMLFPPLEVICRSCHCIT